MREEILFTINAPYRENLPVRGWRFGNSAQKTLAIMGALRGNEVQQMYVCSRLIRELEKLEAADALMPDTGILVIPCANQFSMNVGRRFWAADNTDINRMFPGYDQGETTQRIAARVFNALQDYRYGIHLTSLHNSGNFLPHVRMMDTGYQNAEEALTFGLPYAVLRTPQPYDTTTLNYNWQIWNTTAFSLYTREVDLVDDADAQQAMDAILRFLSVHGLISWPEATPGESCVLFREDTLRTVLSAQGGLLLHTQKPGAVVTAGQLLADILDPCIGAVRERLTAPCSGRIFFAHQPHLINGRDVAFRILPQQNNGSSDL